MTTCWIALGGNLGSVHQTFERAAHMLDTTPGVSVRATSRIHQTAPVGDQAGTVYCNAAMALETGRTAPELLDLLQTIENQFGRTREIHWGPRTLDLDLILYEQEVIDQPGLRVPHPACWYRRFVLDPLVEIAAEIRHPEKGATIAELRQRLLVRPLRMALAGGTESQQIGILNELAPIFPNVAFCHWQAEQKTSFSEPTLIAWLGPANSLDSFHSLPQLPRLDASHFSDTIDSLRHVLSSALG